MFRCSVRVSFRSALFYESCFEVSGEESITGSPEHVLFSSEDDRVLN